MAMPASRVLIADDHPAILRGLAAFIRGLPAFRLVGEAATGMEALALAKSLKPDIVIADYAMPGMNGQELTARLRKNEPGAEVLIYSLHDEVDVILGSIASGARAYVLKTETDQHLSAALAALAHHQPYFSGLAAEALVDAILRTCGIPDTSLSNLEREVIRLVAAGMTSANIAKALGVPQFQIKLAHRRIREKTGAGDLSHLVRDGIHNGLLNA